jgi:RimJ/RimL family protein N-acetyltransferase
MNSYSCLTKQKFSDSEYSLEPIRIDDKYQIMRWRNEQLYHLRQLKALTEIEQDSYFSDVVVPLFDQRQPNQILFSYLKRGVCLGYGGLVHINWWDKNAELSFIMNTGLERNEFGQHWTTFLKLIQKVAFESLGFHKIFTFAFDLRPHLYEILINNGFVKEAVLKEHAKFEDQFIDVHIHAKINGDSTI